MSLLETMLVMVIAASIIVLSANQYVIWKRSGDVLQLQANVDAYFQSASLYYQANCRSEMQKTVNAGVATFAPIAGSSTLDVAAPPSQRVLSTATLTNNYLLHAIAQSPIVSSYIVQLNQQPTEKRYLQNSPSPIELGNIKVWTIQVSALVSNASMVQQFKNMSGAQCTSRLNGTYVRPCSDNQPGNYLVWERLPYNASSSIVSPLWPSMPGVLGFVYMYTTPPASEQANLQPATQNFLCGS